MLDKTGKKHCMWTQDERRIDVVVSSDGGVMVSLSKDADLEIS